MLVQPRRRAAQYVVKLSKYCNLRCSYCYELAELGLKHRMSLEQIASLFRHAADHAQTNGLDDVEFVWHGGEPFLIPIEVYEAIAALQREIFGDRVACRNVVQSNLTVLTDRHVELLRSNRFFSGLGVSFDVYGDQRVDTKGRLRTETVLKNIERLIAAEIPFGVITVLARNTLPHARAIYRFFDSLGLQSRFLPFYLSAEDAQVSAHALTFQEIVQALNDIFDDWLMSETATIVQPVQDHIDIALDVMTGTQATHYDKFADEIVFLVNTDGSVHGTADAYDAQRAYGNVFEEAMEAILVSPRRLRACEEAAERSRRYCGDCPLKAYCPGSFVADATPEQRRLLARSGCPLRAGVEHILKRMDETGVAPLLPARAVGRRNDAALAPL